MVKQGKSLFPNATLRKNLSPFRLWAANLAEGTQLILWKASSYSWIKAFRFFSLFLCHPERMSPIFPTKPSILKISIFPSSCSGSILHYSMASWLIMGSYIALHRPACSDVCVALQGICPAGGRKPEVPWWHMSQIANIGLSDLCIGQRTQDKVGQLKFSSSLSLSLWWLEIIIQVVVHFNAEKVSRSDCFILSWIWPSFEWS